MCLWYAKILHPIVEATGASVGGPETSPPRILKDDCILKHTARNTTVVPFARCPLGWMLLLPRFPCLTPS